MMAHCTGEPEEQEPRQCRICLCNDSREALVAPCWCRGSVALVHVTCLENWLSQTRTTACELCLYQYRTVRTPMYRPREALLIWLRHPRHLNRIRDEVLLTTILTITMLLLSVSSMMAVQYFMDQSLAAMSHGVMLGLICFLVGSIVIFYFYTLYVLLKEELSLWYSWWKGTCQVKIVLTSPSTNVNETSEQE